MTQTDDHGVCRGICINSGGTASGRGFPLILHVGRNSINVRALAERIVIANAHNITLEVEALVASLGIFEAVGRFSVNIAETKERLAPPQRGASPDKVMP